MGLKTFIGKCAKGTKVKVVLAFSHTTVIYDTCDAQELYPDMENDTKVDSFKIEDGILVIRVLPAML